MLAEILRIAVLVLFFIGLLNIKKRRLRHIPTRRTRIPRQYAESTLWLERLTDAAMEMIRTALAEHEKSASGIKTDAGTSEGQHQSSNHSAAAAATRQVEERQQPGFAPSFLHQLREQVEERINALLEDRGIAAWADFRILAMGDTAPLVKALHIKQAATGPHHMAATPNGAAAAASARGRAGGAAGKAAASSTGSVSLSPPLTAAATAAGPTAGSTAGVLSAAVTTSSQAAPGSPLHALSTQCFPAAAAGTVSTAAPPRVVKANTINSSSAANSSSNGGIHGGAGASTGGHPSSSVMRTGEVEETYLLDGMRLPPGSLPSATAAAAGGGGAATATLGSSGPDHSYTHTPSHHGGTAASTDSSPFHGDGGPSLGSIDVEAELEYSGNVEMSLNADIAFLRGRHLPVYVRLGEVRYLRVHLRVRLSVEWESATVDTPAQPYLRVALTMESDPAFDLQMRTCLTQYDIRDFFLVPIFAKYFLLRFVRSRLRPTSSDPTSAGGFSFRLPLPEDIVDGGEQRWSAGFGENQSEAPVPWPRQSAASSVRR